jgi:hypothetical protein
MLSTKNLSPYFFVICFQRICVFFFRQSTLERSGSFRCTQHLLPWGGIELLPWLFAFLPLEKMRNRRGGEKIQVMMDNNLWNERTRPHGTNGNKVTNANQTIIYYRRNGENCGIHIWNSQERLYTSGHQSSYEKWPEVWTIKNRYRK